MAHTLTARPGTWSGTRSPIIYTIIRNDFNPGNLIDNGAGFVRLESDSYLDFAVGTKIALVSHGGALSDWTGQYLAVGEVTFSESYPSPTFHLSRCDLDIPFNGALSINDFYINNLSSEPINYYHIYVEVWSNENPQGSHRRIATAKYSADKHGLTLIDVSWALNSILNANNDSDLTLAGNQSYRDVNIHCQFYIKWQLIYEAPTILQSDIAFIKNAIYGSRQIGDFDDGVGNLVMYNDYGLFDFANGGVRWPVKVVRPVALLNYPYTINFFAAEHTILFVSVGANGVISTEEISGASTVNGCYRLKIHSTNNLIKQQEIVVISSTAYVNTVVFTTGSALIPGQILPPVVLIENFASIDIQSGFYILEVSGTSTISGGSGTQMVVTAQLLSGGYGGTVIQSVQITLTDTDTDTNATVAFIGYSGYADTIYVIGEYTVSGGGDGSFQGTATLKSRNQSEALIVRQNNDDCENIVMLQWRNSLGTDECFAFQHNQEIYFDYGDYKAKRATLFAENLTEDQWDAIQDLNTLGKVVRKAWGNSFLLKKSHERVGQQAYVINSAGNKIAVLVIRQSNSTYTKQKKHTAVITIEYPEHLSA